MIRFAAARVRDAEASGGVVVGDEEEEEKRREEEKRATGRRVGEKSVDFCSYVPAFCLPRAIISSCIVQS